MRKNWNLERRNFLQGVTASSLGLVFAENTAKAQAKLPVSIVNTRGNATSTIQQVLKSKDFLGQYGVTGTMTYVNDASKLMGALVSGEADICTLAGFGPALAAIARGAKLKIIAGAMLKPEHAFYSGKPAIKSVRDLAGKTVATGSPGALIYAMTVAVLRKYGVDPKTVTFVNAGSAPDIFRMVSAGVVDAGIAEIDVYPQQAQYHVHVLDGGDVWAQLPGFTYQATYASDSAIARKRDTLVRTLAAYGQLYRFLSSPQSKDDYIAAQALVEGKSNPVAASWQWQFFEKTKIYATGLVLDQTRIDYMQKLNVSMGVQQAVLPYAEVADMSLAQDALKMLGS
jgi:ABC-type nitrate/sulfonate/bicarbonate transport system substrate-binding protein